jgi:hypothetical protein
LSRAACESLNQRIGLESPPEGKSRGQIEAPAEDALSCQQFDPSCVAQIIKIEYWQFFGYSHDFQNPAAPITDLAGPATTAILADARYAER